MDYLTTKLGSSDRAAQMPRDPLGKSARGGLRAANGGGHIASIRVPQHNPCSDAPPVDAPLSTRPCRRISPTHSRRHTPDNALPPQHLGRRAPAAASRPTHSRRRFPANTHRPSFSKSSECFSFIWKHPNEGKALTRFLTRTKKRPGSSQGAKSDMREHFCLCPLTCGCTAETPTERSTRATVAAHRRNAAVRRN